MTLTEFIQGPCTGNQSLLSKSNITDAIAGVWDAIAKAVSHHPNGPASDSASSFGSWQSLKSVDDLEVCVSPP